MERDGGDARRTSTQPSTRDDKAEALDPCSCRSSALRSCAPEGIRTPNLLIRSPKWNSMPSNSNSIRKSIRPRPAQSLRVPPDPRRSAPHSPHITALLDFPDALAATLKAAASLYVRVSTPTSEHPRSTLEIIG